MEGLKPHWTRKEKKIISKGNPSLRRTSGFGNQLQTLLKDSFPGADNTTEQPNSSHYFLSHITHNHTCPSLRKPTFPKTLFQEKPVCASGHLKEGAKMLGRLWRTIDSQVTRLGWCPHSKVAIIQALVNRRSRALGSQPCLQEISPPEDKAPTNYIEKILCIDKSKAKGNTPETKLNQNMECWRACIQIKRKKHFLLLFTFL